MEVENGVQMGPSNVSFLSFKVIFRLTMIMRVFWGMFKPGVYQKSFVQPVAKTG